MSEKSWNTIISPRWSWLGGYTIIQLCIHHWWTFGLFLVCVFAIMNIAAIYVFKCSLCGNVSFLWSKFLGAEFPRSKIGFSSQNNKNKNHNHSLIMMENIRKIPKRAILQNTWLVLLRTVKVIKNMDNLRSCQGKKRNPRTTTTKKSHWIKTKEL